MIRTLNRAFLLQHIFRKNFKKKIYVSSWKFGLHIKPWIPENVWPMKTIIHFDIQALAKPILSHQ